MRGKKQKSNWIRLNERKNNIKKVIEWKSKASKNNLHLATSLYATIVFPKSFPNKQKSLKYTTAIGVSYAISVIMEHIGAFPLSGKI